MKNLLFIICVLFSFGCTGQSFKIIKQNEKYGIIEIPSQNIIKPFVYDYIQELGGLIEIYQNNKYGLITKSGEEITPCVYSDINHYSGYNIFTLRTYVYNKPGKEIYIDSTGKRISNLEFDIPDGGGYHFTKYFYAMKYSMKSINYYHENYDYIWVKQNNKWGILKISTQKLVISCKYEMIMPGFNRSNCDTPKSDWNYNCLRVILNKKQYYIDTNENVLTINEIVGIPNKFEFLTGRAYYKNDFEIWANNRIVIEKNNKQVIIDTTGKIIVDALYDEIDISNYKNNFLRIKINDKYGVIDSMGKIVISPTYSYMWYDGHRYKIIQDYKRGYMDLKGNIDWTYWK